jgi:hypothetical protein
MNIFVFLFPRNAELFINYTLIQLEQMFANFYFIILRIPVDRELETYAITQNTHRYIDWASFWLLKMNSLSREKWHDDLVIYTARSGKFPDTAPAQFYNSDFYRKIFKALLHV